MNFEYTIKRSKGRNIRISINRKAQVFLHVPKYIPQFLAKRFLKSKADWVNKSLEKVRKNVNLKTKKEIKNEYANKKEEARKLVLQKLDFWRDYYKSAFQVEFSWNRVAIKNSKTRWGSCSSKRNLNFSFRILSLTEQAQDYLIVHELCHLSEMNHSKNFWRLVSFGIPGYKNLRKELKDLHLG